jgi:hypothetical protein
LSYGEVWFLLHRVSTTLFLFSVIGSSNSSRPGTRDGVDNFDGAKCIASVWLLVQHWSYPNSWNADDEEMSR